MAIEGIFMKNIMIIFLYKKFIKICILFVYEYIFNL